VFGHTNLQSTHHFALQNYWIDDVSSVVHISLPPSLVNSSTKPSIFTRISSSLAASPPAQLLSKLRRRSAEAPSLSDAASPPEFLPLPRKTSEEASAAAAHILDALSILESDAASAAANLQQLVAHLNDHTQRSTIIALPHAGCIKEAAAASAFYSHQSSQAIIDFIARQFSSFLFHLHVPFSLVQLFLNIFYDIIFLQHSSDHLVNLFSLSYEELLVLARPLKETAETVKT
jgi:hypothetical protein